MKFSFFASILAIFTAVVTASPTSDPSLQSRTGGISCDGRTQFFYKQRNCCLDKGGPKTSPTTPSGRDCPRDWYWHLGQGCCTPRNPVQDNTPDPQCPKTRFRWKKATQCCEQDDDHNDNHPVTSPKPDVPRGNNGGKDDKDCKDDDKNGHKRSNASDNHTKKRSMKSRDVTLCPRGFEACPIPGITGTDYECISPLEDITSCGGCTSLGKGQDCTAVANAWNVACNAGTCAVLTCETGYQVSPDGASCTRL